MSTHRKIEWSLFVLGLCGMAFSGYLSAGKFFTDSCPVTGACPYFLGYPACYFGLLMYTLIALFAGLHVFHAMDGAKANRAVLLVAALGVFFAGYYTLLELPILFAEGPIAYLQGLPTCAMGLVLYIAITVLSHRLRRDFRPAVQH